ncbi:MAG: DUF1553 domain-containing protein [Planctomycetota bacterium]|nr:DUF1553 domain-containing protein [Planctomycetota bacterium]
MAPSATRTGSPTAMKAQSLTILAISLLAATTLPAQDTSEKHWAFIPPQRPSVPEIAADSWSHSPIDRFILAELHKRKMAGGPRADRARLLRRASLDLLGIPPTRDQVQAFLQDHQPGAWARLVDRLLASPRYGERWGRHWLDLARYADSNGFEFDFVRPHAWHYRDYVINSFNTDQPYDDFVRAQIAGDELNPADFPSWVATGFCRNGPTVGNQALEKNRYEELHDIISTTSEVFLGLTLGCARCHDHKYDPLPQRDYYSMLAIFHTSGNRSQLIGSTQNRQDKSRLEKEIRDRREQLRKLTDQPAPGKWRLADGVLYQDITGNNVRTVLGNRDWKNYSLQVDVRKTSGTTEPFNFNAGIYLGIRTQDFRNGFLLHLGASDNREHAILRETNGSFVRLAPRVAGTIKTNQWYTIKLTAHDGRLQAWLDQQRLFDIQDDHFPTGKLSLGNWLCQTEWRNLRVTSVDGTILQAGFPELQPSHFPPAPDVTFTRDSLNQQIQLREAQLAQLPIAMAITDEGSKAKVTHVHQRGDYRQPGEEVGPGVPSALVDRPLVFPEPAKGQKTTGRRTVLANWLVDRQNPLAARVMVNRIWQFHFGVGLVETASNFGLTGMNPTHPELLDWLAVEFMEHDWSIKHLHQLIMKSAVYCQMSASPDPRMAAHRAADPHGHYLSRFPLRRHEAEVIRDRILWASGALNLQMHGPGIMPRIHPGVLETSSTRKWPVIEEESFAHWRRSVYIFIRRSVMFPLLESFDAPVTTQSCERRVTTTVPTQALQMMNDRFTNEHADLMAADIARALPAADSKQIQAVYWRALARAPTPQELNDCTAFLEMMQRYHREQLPATQRGAASVQQLRHKSLTDLCHVIFNLNEFVYQD